MGEGEDEINQNRVIEALICGSLDGYIISEEAAKFDGDGWVKRLSSRTRCGGRGMVGAGTNVLCGTMKCGQTEGDCGVNRAHSRQRYSREGGREVVLQLEGGNICYGCGRGSGRFVRSSPR